MYNSKVLELAAALDQNEKPHGLGFNMAYWLELPVVVSRAVCELYVLHRKDPTRFRDSLGELNYCGTAACMAGHAVAHFEGLSALAEMWAHSTVTIHHNAARILGLNSNQAAALLIPADPSTVSKSQAAAMLRWMVSEGDDVTYDQIKAQWRVLRAVEDFLIPHVKA